MHLHNDQPETPGGLTTAGSSAGSVSLMKIPDENNQTPHLLMRITKFLVRKERS